MKAGDKYLKIVEWSEEDGCYVGTCPPLFYGGVHGPDEIKVYKELCRVVEEVLEDHAKENIPLPKPTVGKTFSGKFVLRVGEELHRALYLEALRHRESLNSFCTNLLKEHQSPMKAKKICKAIR